MLSTYSYLTLLFQRHACLYTPTHCELVRSFQRTAFTNNSSAGFDTPTLIIPACTPCLNPTLLVVQAHVQHKKRRVTIFGCLAMENNDPVGGVKIDMPVQPITFPPQPADAPASNTVEDPLTPDDLDSMTETLRRMASSAEPVINDFDEVQHKAKLVSLNPNRRRRESAHSHVSPQCLLSQPPSLSREAPERPRSGKTSTCPCKYLEPPSCVLGRVCFFCVTAYSISIVSNPFASHGDVLVLSLIYGRQSWGGVLVPFRCETRGKTWGNMSSNLPRYIILPHAHARPLVAGVRETPPGRGQPVSRPCSCHWCVFSTPLPPTISDQATPRTGAQLVQ